MREIKFRAWDGKRMLNNVGFHPFIIQALWRDPDNGYKEGEDGAYIISPAFTQYILMQFTSLKDKNGKEIYEGDLIEGHLFDKRVPTMGTVRYHVAHSCYVNENLAGLTPLSRIDAIEVIGNIYETPELLNSQAARASNGENSND